ncbi:PIN domain-containing protein [Candidatus Pacearchaeota archaeon]|nr:PIN domain-containing protein [Candidatus Pacearchaeota archaeon]
MSYEYIIDSYAWVEYFKGSNQGKIARDFIENKQSATSVITIAELSEKYEREQRKFDEDFSFIISQTKIIELNTELSILAGKINNENKKKIKNWGMADSIILATAKIKNAKVVTGDEHFRNLNSVMINV